MEQSRILRHLLLALPLIVIAALCGHLIGSLRHAYSQSATSNKTSAPPQQLSAEGQASLHAIIQAENLPELRWPNFSDYDKQVQKFYEMYGYSLPWVRGMEPTEGGAADHCRFISGRAKGIDRGGLRRIALGSSPGKAQTSRGATV